MRRLASAGLPLALLSAGWYAGRRSKVASKAHAQEASAAVQMAHAAVIGLDAAAAITSWNPAAEKIFGHQADQVLGRPLAELLFDGERDVLEALAGGDGGRQEAEAVRADGRQVPVLFALAQVANGGPTRAFLYARDISAQKRLERGQTVLAKTAKLLKSSLDYERTLQAVAELAVPDLADWCGVDLPGPRGLPTSAAIAHARPDRVDLARELRRRYPVSEQGALTQVLRTAESFLQPEVTDEAMVAYASDPQHLRLLRAVGCRSLMVVPLKAGRRTIGAMTFVAAESAHRFDERDLALAEELAQRAGSAVENARLAGERAEVTRTLLATLRPPKLPVIPGWETATLYQPAERTSEVGGDFYDIFSVGDGWMLVIGDVIGKGPTAAALTSLARWSIRSAATATGRPSQALAHLNADLDREGQPALLSAACVLLEELRDGRAQATVAVAGHPLPVLVGEGEPRPVGRHSLLLGVLPDTQFRETSVALGEHDSLVLYTDGVLEAPVSEGRLGEAGLLEAVRAPTGSARELVGQIADRTGAQRPNPQRDDIAVLVARRTAAERRVRRRPVLVSA